MKPPACKKGINVYAAVNALFIAVILAIFIYSFVFKTEKHPIPALLTQSTGLIPPSRGLSKSFSEIVRGNIAVARLINPHAVSIFAFFLIQLAMRIAGFAAAKIYGSPFPVKGIAIDICISLALFAYCLPANFLYFKSIRSAVLEAAET